MFSLVWSVLTACLVTTLLTSNVNAGVDPKVKKIHDTIKSVLTKLSSPDGMSGEDLAKSARDVAQLADSFIVTSGVAVGKESTGKLFVELSKDYIHNMAALAALFGDVLTLDATKLDSAFVLWDELAKLLPVSPDIKSTVVALTAIKQTAEAIEAVVSDATQQFHFQDSVPPKRRDTTVSGHVEHGSGGTSAGVRVSHSWRRRR